MITVDLTSSDLEYKLARLAATVPVDLSRIIKQEGGYMAKTMMLIIPPTLGKGKSDNIDTGRSPRNVGISKAAQEQGFNAIKGDLFGGVKMAKSYSIGLFQTIGESIIREPRNQGNQTLRVYKGNNESSKSFLIMHKFWRPEASTGDMAKFRKQYRNKYGRTGHVSQNTIGRWKVQDQMWVNKQSADSYFAILKSRVGWNKSGFAAGAIACGIRVPAWIRKHASSSGTETHSFGANPFIRVTALKNSIPNIQRYVDSAFRIRSNVTQKKIDRILSSKAVSLGFGKVTDLGKFEENPV